MIIPDGDGGNAPMEPAVGGKLDQCKVPRWLIRAARRVYPEWKPQRYYERFQFPPASMAEDGWCRPIIDHQGGCKDARRGSVYVSEPYPLNSDQIRRLLKICEKLGIDFEVSANSYHSPTRTLRITFFEREKETR
jgi:hypothetical protein